MGCLVALALLCGVLGVAPSTGKSLNTMGTPGLAGGRIQPGSHPGVCKCVRRVCTWFAASRWFY